MKAREIILLVLIIAGGIILTQEKTGKVWPGWRAGDFLFFDGRSFAYQETAVVEPPLPAVLKVVNRHGDVTVEAADTERVTLTLEKIVRRRDEPEARAVADKLHATVAKDGTAVTIGTNRDDFSNPRFDTNFRLTVPAGLAVEVENSHGAVRVSGVARASVANPHGEVRASGIAGALKVENDYEDVSIDGVQGDCAIVSSHATVLAERVGGSLTVVHSHGAITLRGLAAGATVDASHSVVLAEDVAGSLDIRNSYEPVTLRKVGRVKITGHHTDVEAAEVDGGLEVATDYALVSAESVRGGLSVTGKSVGVSGRGLSEGDIRVETSYEPVELNGFSGKTTLIISHGDVSLAPDPLTGPVEVRGEYAGITLRWPAGGPYPLEARARSGEVVWQLADPVQVEDKEGVQEVRAYSNFTDKPGILITTTYDNILVEER